MGDRVTAGIEDISTREFCVLLVTCGAYGWVLRMRLRLTVSGACGELLPGQPVDGGDHGGGSFGGVAVSGLCGVEAIRQARSKSEIEDLRARSI